jgi:hypothetical protein
MGYSNRELGDLGAMRKRNRQGDLIGWLNKTDEAGIANLDIAQKKAGIKTNATLHKYVVEIIETKELQEAYELSDYGLKMAILLEKWSELASKKNAQVNNERSRVKRQINRERGFR